MKAYKEDCKKKNKSHFIYFYVKFYKLLKYMLGLFFFLFLFGGLQRKTSVFLPTVRFNLENSKSSNKLVWQLSVQVYKLRGFQYQSCLQFCPSENPISLKA